MFIGQQLFIYQRGTVSFGYCLSIVGYVYCKMMKGVTAVDRGLFAFDSFHYQLHLIFY